MNLFISSFKRLMALGTGNSGSPPANWRTFLKTTLLTFIGGVVAVYALILVIDPYDVVWFSPPLARKPVSTNQRYSYPAFARDVAFDSVIIGTSTARLIKPERLNTHFGAKFANLAMNSATAYEQSKILKLFLRHHPKPRCVIIAIDTVWAQSGSDDQKYTFRPFPEWMYDDLGGVALIRLLNLETVQQSVRQLRYLSGLRPPRFGYDGYEIFVPDQSQYDLAKARKKIYGSPQPRVRQPVQEKAIDNTQWSFPAHLLLQEILEQIPQETMKIILFVPYHIYNQPLENTSDHARWSSCKQQITKMSSGLQNVVVLDFMIESKITCVDENYWDPLHCTVAVGEQLSDLIYEGASQKKDKVGYYLVLNKP
ncbi:MAG: hypothetical protein ABFQ95_04940 [Pseudomonadota bacterium]